MADVLLFLLLFTLSLKRLFRVQEMVYERGGDRAGACPKALFWVASSHVWPSFVLQLTCVGVGDVCNKGKVRGNSSQRHLKGTWEVLWKLGSCKCFLARICPCS